MTTPTRTATRMAHEVATTVKTDEVEEGSDCFSTDCEVAESMGMAFDMKN